MIAHRHLRRLLLPISLVLVALMAYAWVPDVSAQDGFGLDRAAKTAGVTRTEGIAVIIGGIVRTALSLVATVFLILMVYAGFLYLTARGDSKKVDQAKQLIVGAIIGIIVVASAYAITGFVLSAATRSGQAEQIDVPDGSAATGATCQTSDDCAAVTDVCESGKCVTTIESP